MVKLSQCIYDSINKRFSVIDVIDRFFPNDYEQSPESNGWVHYNPCPFTGSMHFAFCVHTDDSGFQIYQLKSSNFERDEFDQLPESGTAAHILSILFKSENELLKLLIGQEVKINPSIQKPRIATKPEKKHQPLEELERLQYYYRKAIENNADYLTRVRKFSLETIEHFKIGYRSYDDVFTYPYILDGRIKHFKYKNAGKVFQMKDNSGGDYLFNADALKQDRILIVEGEHDVMMVWQKYGIEAVGLGGNFGMFSEKYNQIVEASQDKTVLLCFDDDDAGKDYTDDFQLWLANIAKEVIEVGHTGEGKDPDEWIKSGGELLFVK
jgi:DNA primase